MNAFNSPKREDGVVVVVVTSHHELNGPVHRLLLRPPLAAGLQVLQDVDVWCKVDHVLLTTTIRHLHQRVQATDGRAKEISWSSTTKEEEQEEEQERGSSTFDLDFILLFLVLFF